MPSSTLFTYLSICFCSLLLQQHSVLPSQRCMNRRRTHLRLCNQLAIASARATSQALHSKYMAEATFLCSSFTLQSACDWAIQVIRPSTILLSKELHVRSVDPGRFHSARPAFAVRSRYTIIIRCRLNVLGSSEPQSPTAKTAAYTSWHTHLQSPGLIFRRAYSTAQELSA